MSANILKGAFNGLSWGPTTAYRVAFLRGLDDLPTIISRDQPKAVLDGTFPGDDLYGEWPITVSLTIAGINTTDSAFRGLMDAANAAFKLSATIASRRTPLPLQWWNLERYVYARVRSRVWSDIDARTADHVATVTVGLVVVDATAYIGTPP